MRACAVFRFCVFQVGHAGLHAPIPISNAAPAVSERASASRCVRLVAGAMNVRVLVYLLRTAAATAAAAAAVT